MNNFKVSNVLLWALILFGFLGAIKVSYENFTGNHCPYIAFVPICYVVLVAYGLMVIAMLVSSARGKHFVFCIGWGTAFLIALVGSIAEFTGGGGVCPTTGGGVRGASSGSIPLCYASLAMTVIILILFLMGPYKKACDIHNSQQG